MSQPKKASSSKIIKRNTTTCDNNTWQNPASMARRPFPVKHSRRPGALSLRRVSHTQPVWCSCNDARRFGDGQGTRRKRKKKIKRKIYVIDLAPASLQTCRTYLHQFEMMSMPIPLLKFKYQKTRGCSPSCSANPPWSNHCRRQIGSSMATPPRSSCTPIFLTVFRTRANRLLIPWRQRRHLGRSELCKQHYAKQNTSVYVTITDYNHPHAWNLVSQGKPSAGELASWLQGANQYHGFSWFSLHNWPESVAPKCVRILNHDQFLVNQQLMCRNSGLKTAAPAIQ